VGRGGWVGCLRWWYCGYGWCGRGCCFWVFRGACGGGGVLVPLTFRISCLTWSSVLSSHIIISGMRPDLLGFFTIMRSPLSSIYRPHRRASRYVSALFVYSAADRNTLHFSCPLFFLIASYSNRRADFDAQSMARRYSPFGVATLLHPVRTVKSVPSCFESNWCHSSTFPLYLRWCVYLLI
jgi:hypothetical protein